MKVVTLCGSLKFKNEMMIVAEKMSLEGYCVLTPIYLSSDGLGLTKNQISSLKEEHLKKVELSNSILVVNVNNYIGENTKLEIEYAKKLGKKIMYYTDLKLYN